MPNLSNLATFLWVFAVTISLQPPDPQNPSLATLVSMTSHRVEAWKTAATLKTNGSTKARSGFTKILHYFNNRIDENIPSICPLCAGGAGADHSTNHLSNCSSNPTTLTTESLWTDPIKAAQILQLDMEQEPEIPPWSYNKNKKNNMCVFLNQI